MRAAAFAVHAAFAAALAALPGAGAQAETFRLSYGFSFGSVLEAEITGDLQEDGDTVIVSSVAQARLDGVAGPEMPFVTSLADLVDGTAGHPPVLTLSGEGNDFSVCSDESCTGDFITFDGVKQVFGMPGIFTSPAFGNTMSGGAHAGETYDAARYILEPA